MKDDVCGFVNEFHSIGILPKAVTTSFLTLIPKVDNLDRWMIINQFFLLEAYIESLLNYSPVV